MSIGTWFWTSTRAWRVLGVTNPTTRRTRWLGPRSLTTSEVHEWQVDTREQNWNQEVTVYTWTGTSWRYGV